MAKLNPDRHITRASHYDSKGNSIPSGYMVRFTRRGKHYQAYFSDSRNGGQKKALAVARKHRDEMEPKFKLLNPIERANVKMSTNTSGTVGVRWATKTIKKAKKTYVFEFAVASWTGAEGRQTKSYSVDKYGKEQAWKLAVKARKAGLAALAKSLKD